MFICKTGLHRVINLDFNTKITKSKIATLNS